MKLKKLFAFVLAACAALALGVGLIACDGETNPDPKPDPKPGPTEKTISYQYTGANDELYGYGWAYYVMLNLWSDGSVTGSGYNYIKTDGSGLKEKWFRGTWSEKEDEDAGKYVQLKAIWDEDATNDMSGGVSTAGRMENYSLYFDDDGKTLLPFTLKIPLMSERNAEMTCHVPALYADKEAFIAGALEYGEAHKPAEGGDEEHEGTVLATLTATDGKTAKFYDDGIVVVEANGYKPEWNWEYTDGEFILTESDGNNAGSVVSGATLTVEGTTGTLEYDGYGNTHYTYTGDVSALIGAEAEPTVLTTLTAEGGYTATFYDNGTVKVTTSMAQLSPTWNWEYKDNTIAFTEENSENVPGGVTFTLEGTTGTLVYAPSFLQGTSFTYTGDVSALIGAEAEPTVLTTLTAEGGYTATFYDNGTVKVTTSMAQLSPTWKWEYKDNTIAFTEENNDNVPGGVTFTLEGTTGTLVYAPSFLQGTSFTYTGDVSALIA